MKTLIAELRETVEAVWLAREKVVCARIDAGACGTRRDFTKMREAEREMHAAEERYESMMKTLAQRVA